MKKRTLIVIACLSILIFAVNHCTAADETEYTIGPGDTLEIHAWNKDNPDILVVNPVATTQGSTIVTTISQDTHSVTVSRDGRIYVPLVGVIKVENLSTKALEDLILKGLKSYAPDASVTVLIKNPKPVKVYIMGQVVRPGMYGIPDGNPEECRLVNFVNLAGGFTSYSDISHITVIRGTTSREADFYRIESDGDIGQNMILKDGDTVVVPERFNQVYVLGYVVRPGAVRYIEGAKVADYIGSVGGLTRFAASDNIGIVRGDPSNPTVIKVKVNNYLAWQNDSNNPRILPGDVIYVPQSWFADWADMSAIMIGFRDSRNAVRDLVSGPEWDPSVNR